MTECIVSRVRNARLGKGMYCTQTKTQTWWPWLAPSGSLCIQLFRVRKIATDNYTVFGKTRQTHKHTILSPLKLILKRFLVLGVWSLPQLMECSA